MEMSLDSTNALMGRPQIVVSHKGESTTWHIGAIDKTFDRKFESDPALVFSHINAYWQTLPDTQVELIFSIYKQIRSLPDSLWSRDQTSIELYTLVGRLMDVYDFEDIRRWILFKSTDINLPDPSVCKSEYVIIPGRPSTREQTYLMEDYIKLITMSLMLRTMIPIWGEYIGKTKNGLGKTLKEFYAFHLLTQSKIANSEVMEKLTTYVRFMVPKDKSIAGSIMGGLSSSDFPIWLLSLVVIRRLCTADIRGIEPKSTMVSLIYSFVDGKLKSADNTIYGTINGVEEKKFTDTSSQSSDGDRSLSRLEGYKTKAPIAEGDFVIIEHIAKDVLKIAKTLEPTLDKKRLQQAFKTSACLNVVPLLDAQVVILQWVMKPVLPPLGIRYLTKKTITRLLALCQTVLWHRGHYDLAGLCTATPSLEVDEMQISGIVSRAHIPKDLTNALLAEFPYFRRPTGKQKAGKPVNPVLAAVDNLTKLIAMSDWILTADDELVRLIADGNIQRRYLLPHDIRIKLATLLLDLVKR
jgi:hypothetical protein